MSSSKVVIITGAGKGIGKALAIRLSNLGHKIVISGRNRNELKKTAKRLKGDYLVEQCDISIWEQCEKLSLETVKKFGETNVLVNNAAGWLDKSLIDSSKNEISELIDTTVKGNLYITKICLKQMVKQRSGHILSLLPSSYPYSISEYNGTVLTPYYTAKFGEAGMSEALKKEAKKDNINVTSLYLGSVASKIDIEDIEKKSSSNRLDIKSVVDAVVFCLNQRSNSVITSLTIKTIFEQ